MGLATTGARVPEPTMQPIEQATGKINLARPYVPVGAVFGIEETTSALLLYSDGRHPPEL